MNEIKEIIQTFNTDNYVKFDINNLINILDNLTNIERNIIFNKLYSNNNMGSGTILQYVYLFYSNGHEVLIDLLKKYKNNININIKNIHGTTLLYYIAYNKEIEILKLIYELYKDVNINIIDNNNNNLLYNIMLLRICNENIVKFLLEKNAKIQYELLKRMINIYNYEKIYYNKYMSEYMSMVLEYLHKNDDYDYVLEELYKYVIENVEINEDNKEFYEKLFVIRSSVKSAAKVLISS